MLAFFAFLLTLSVSSLHHDELVAIKADICRLYDTFPAPPGFFLPSRAIMLAFHDSGTWSEVTQDGGAHATQFYDCVGDSPCEQTDAATAGLGWARAALETVYVKYKTICSRADFWQIAGIVAIWKTGGPEIPFRWGRIDAGTAANGHPGRLPGSTSNLTTVRSFLGPGRLGFTDREIVAFMGSHTLGSAHIEISGHRYHWDSTPHVFDNGYFQSLLRDDWTFVDINGSYQWEATRVGPGGVTDKFLMLISDFCLKSSDPATKLNSLSPTNAIVQFYALNEEVWKQDFAKLWLKLSELGQTGLLKDVLPARGNGTLRLDLPPELRKNEQHSNAGVVAGICVGVTVGLVVVGLIIYAASRYVKNSQMETP